MQMPDRKQWLLLGGITVLVMLNLLYYSQGSSHVSRKHHLTSEVAPLKVPPILKRTDQYHFQRDIFQPVEVKKTTVAAVKKKQPPPKPVVPTPKPEKRSTPVLPKFTVRGVGSRQGHPFAMIEYKGQIKVVSAGDVLAGDYRVDRIEGTKVYISAQQH